MIRIYETKIEKLEDIKKNHRKAVEQIVRKSIEKFKYLDNKYKVIKEENKEIKSIVEFDEKDKKFLESLLGAEIKNEENLKIYFNKDNKNIDKLAVGKLADIFKLYYKAIKELEEFENIEYDDLEKLFIIDNYRKKIIKEIEGDKLKGGKLETVKKRKSVLEKYFDNPKYFINLSYFDDEFKKQYNNGDEYLRNKKKFTQTFKLKNEYQNGIKRVEELNEILKFIFSYESFQNGENIKINGNIKKWDRHMLISSLNISTCPYCNRQYISNYIDKDLNSNTTADLDHFYSQSKYPFLALSLYNFIPSCQICNSRFKLQKDFYLEKHLYPYEESFGENAWFETDFIKHENGEYNIDFLFGVSNDFIIDIKVKKDIENELKNKINNSIDTFNLKEIYKNHIDYVRELIKKSIVYNESKITELYTQYPELFKNRTEVIQMLVSNYISDEEDLGKRPLAKLTMDICKELGL